MSGVDAALNRVEQGLGIITNGYRAFKGAPNSSYGKPSDKEVIDIHKKAFERAQRKGARNED